MANWIERADATLASLLEDWSIYTTVIAIAIATLLTYPILFPSEPDTHPLLLARQSTAALVRQKNHSATYRSPEAPHGYPLRTGLNVKDPGAPRWASGKDGDLRDVWRELMRGGSTEAEGKTVPKGLLLTVLGKEEVVEHEVEDLTRQIIVIGEKMKGAGCRRVAIYLPNSMEYLLTIFACAFYGLTPVLLPYNQPHPKIYDLLNSTDADALVCAAGNLPLEDLAKACPNLHQLTWVVEKTSRHMDWNGTPSDNLKTSVWHDVVEESNKAASPSAELPNSEDGEDLGDLLSVWQPTSSSSQSEIVTFTQKNIVSAVGAMLTVLPHRQRLGPSDLVVPADSFNSSYTLCWTLASLFSHASVAITSVAGPGVDFASASRSVSPTVVIASAETMAQLHAKEVQGINSGFQKLGMASHASTMNSGRMPTDTLLFKLLAPSSTGDTKPGKLRVVLTAECIGAGSPPLSSSMLSDLRIFTKARICYALTAAKVAGAIAQSNIFDYRTEAGQGPSHFGGVLSSVEVTLAGDDKDLAGSEPVGEIVVEGPSVSDGKLKTGARGKFREDGCLSYA